MKTYFDRMTEKRQRAIERVNAVMSHVTHFKLTHSDMLQKLGEIYASKDWQSMTVDRREYVRGYIDAKIQEIYRNHIAWGFKPKGVFVADFDTVLRDYHDEVEADRCNGFHYWKESNGEKPW